MPSSWNSTSRGMPCCVVEFHVECHDWSHEVCMHLCVYVFVCAYVCVCMYICMDACLCMFMCLYMCLYHKIQKNGRHSLYSMYHFGYLRNNFHVPSVICDVHSLFIDITYTKFMNMYIHFFPSSSCHLSSLF